MTDVEIKNIIRKYVQEEYLDANEIDSFTDESPLITSGLIDSISILQVVDFLEESFGFEFEPHEVDQANLNTIEIMLTFLKSKIAAK